MKKEVVTATVAVLAGALSVPQLCLGGAYFESMTRTEGEGLGRDGQLTSVRAWIDGAKAKVEFQQADQTSFFSEGSYMLTTDGGQTLYLVDPGEMTYAELNLDQLLGMAGSIMEAAGGVVQMEFSDFTNEKVAEEPGEDVLGYSTTRYEYRTGYTMSMGVLGFRRDMRSDMQQEFWCTDELDAAGFRVWLSPDRFRTGNAEIDELIKSQYQDLDCLPLRTRMVTRMTGEGGRETSTVSTTEVTLLREEDSIDAATFELPAGYTATSLIPELPAGFGSPEGASPAETRDQEEEGRPRLRDLFPR